MVPPPVPNRLRNMTISRETAANFDNSYPIISDGAGSWIIGKTDSPNGAGPNLLLTQITQQRRRLDQFAAETPGSICSGDA